MLQEEGRGEDRGRGWGGRRDAETKIKKEKGIERRKD